MRLLFLSSLTYLGKHPLQLLFSILGITLGVAITVGMDLAIFSAKQSFQHSIKSLTGTASHRIVGDNPAVPEHLYTQLRLQLGLKKIAPLIKSQFVLPDFHRKKVRLLGIDPFSESQLRTISQQNFAEISSNTLQQLLVTPNSILVSELFLKEHALKKGDRLAVEIDNHQTSVTIIDSFALNGSLKSELKNWLISDISTAQELIKFQGYISQIDLSLEVDSPVLINKIKRLLPPGVQLLESQQHQQSLSRLSESFELNLTALSLLGLLVAMFLIYNTTMFSVVQRRHIFARLRVMGVTRSELFIVILLEALIIGLIATVLGMVLGFLLAKSLVGLISQTINDLYYSVQVTQFYWQQLSFWKAILLGVGATLISASFPAVEAAYTRPVKVLQRINLEQKTRRWLNYLLISGGIGSVIVFFLIQDQNGGMLKGFIAVFLLIFSIALILPWLIHRLLLVFSITMKAFFALPGKMAVNNISRSLSRSIIAIIALVIAVSATLGIGIMIQSFRLTVDEWLGGYLRADYFISPSNHQKITSPIGLDIKKKIAQLDGVKAVSSDRRRKFFIDNQYHHLIVLDIPIPSFKAFRLKSGISEFARQAWFEEDAVIVSEPYSYRHSVNVGDWISLPTDKQWRKFKVVGVFYHYGSEQGMINMSRTTYQKYWQDNKINSLGVYLQEGVENKQIEPLLVDILSEYDVNLSSKAELHKESMQIFDRTFKITQVLKLLVIIVSFVGILSALMAIALERAREFAILRVIGLSPRQLSSLVYLETLVMGLVAAILAMPMGIILAYLLVDVINYRSFGWSMLFILPPQEFISAALLALVAAIIAAIYPARSLARTPPAVSLRGE